MLVTAANNLKVSHWPNLEQRDDYTIAGEDIISVSWSKNNAFMIYLERNGRPQILSLKDLKNIKAIHLITAIDHASTALFSRNRNGMVAVGTSLGTVALYDTHTKAIVKLYDVPGPVVALDFNCADRYLAVVCKCGHVVILDLSTHQKVFNTDIQEVPTGIRFHPYCESLFGICTSTGKFIFMDVSQNEPLWVAAVASMKTVNAFAFYPKEDRHQVVTVDEDFKVCTYETNAGKCLFRCCLQHPLTAIDYSTDGKFYGVGMANGKVCIFDAMNPRTPACIISIHEKRRIHCLRFSNMACPPPAPSATTCHSQLSCDTRGSSIRPTTINGTEISPETIQSLLSQEPVAVVLDSLNNDIATDLMKYVLHLNAHVQNQLTAFDDFIRKEFEKIELQVQEKWDLVKVMRASVKLDGMMHGADSEDDIDEDLLDDDPTTRGTQDDIVILE